MNLPDRIQPDVADIEVLRASIVPDDGNDDDAPTLLVTVDERYYITETPTSLIFRADTPIEVWGPLTARLIRAQKRLEFALADAINFGRRYGERYPQWVHDDGRSKQALHDIAWVGRQIEPSRRREDVSFSTHREVAPLPPRMQTTILDLATEKKWSQKQVRDAVQIAQKEIKAAERAALPTPTVTTPDCEIVLGDACALSIEAGTVDLIVTSPPYALDKEYPNGDIAAADWWAFMHKWLGEAWRILKDHGRLALNVPLDTTRPIERPTYAQALFAAQKAGFTYRSTIVWRDDQLGKSTARGSYDPGLGSGTAASPSIIFPGETIVLLSKGEWSRPPEPNRPSDINRDDWVDWTNGDWEFPGESRPWEDHPAPFPIELPRRLIHLLSFPGDMVCDPFVGSGTTALAALRAGRRFYGVDREQAYVDAARRRVAASVPARPPG